MTDQRLKSDGIKDAWVDGLLGDLAQVHAQPSDDLMARVLADATAVTAVRRAAVVPVQTGSIWHQLSTMIGGWPAMGGLAAAGVAGLWIGIAPPAGVSTFAADVLGNTESVSLFGTDFDDLLGDAVDG